MIRLMMVSLLVLRGILNRGLAHRHNSPRAPVMETFQMPWPYRSADYRQDNVRLVEVNILFLNQLMKFHIEAVLTVQFRYFYILPCIVVDSI